MFYSKTTRGFYDESIHSSMPDDVVEISAGHYAELMAGPLVGKVISCGDDGFPLLIDPPPPSAEMLAGAERVWRDRQLAATDPLVSRHRDEVEDGGLTSITPEQYGELQRYRRLLRDWPQGEQFPLIDHRPVAPPWLIEQIQ